MFSNSTNRDLGVTWFILLHHRHCVSVAQFISLQVLCLWPGVNHTTLCDKVRQWLTTGQWFSLGTPVSSTNKTDCHDITEILLNTINQIYIMFILGIRIVPYINFRQYLMVVITLMSMRLYHYNFVYEAVSL